MILNAVNEHMIMVYNFFLFMKSAFQLKTAWVFLVVFGVNFSLFHCSKLEEKPPNIVFILVDDLGWKDLGCYGGRFYETPNLDSLATQMIQFNQAYAGASICSPSRAALLTGRHPVRFPITDWIPGQDPKNRPLLGTQDLDALPLTEKTIAEYLKEKGYTTFFAGKWHLGGNGYLPTDQGFDINKGGHDKGSPPGGYYAPYKNPVLEDGLVGEYLPERLTSETIDFLEKHSGQPVFAMLSFYTVHTPIQASINYIDHYEQKAIHLGMDGTAALIDEGLGKTVLEPYNVAYASMVQAMDEQVGRLIRAMKDLDLYDQSLFIFTSDNGGLSTLHHTRNHPAPTSVKPLRAGKGWLYEGGIRVPLLIKPPFWSGDNGLQINKPTIGQDLFATVLKTVGLQTPDSLDGQPLNLWWENPESTSAERTLFWHYPHYHGSGWVPGSAIRRGKWKLLYHYESNSFELFDITLDLGEQSNVLDIFPEVATTMKAEFKRIQREMKVEVPSENPDFEHQ